MENKHKFTDNESVKTFLFAGKATITLESINSGKWFTFKIVKHKKDDIYFVNLLNGPNNDTDFVYLGTIFGKDGKFVKTAKSKIGNDAPSFKGFDWFMRNLNNPAIFDQLNIRHNGICGRCSRKLTTPESLKQGYGPECVKLVYNK